MLRFEGNLIKGPGRPATKPDSFTFLGFTHFLTKTREKKVHIRLTPSIQSRERFLRRVREWLRRNRHTNVRLQQAHLSKMLGSHYQYSVFGSAGDGSAECDRLIASEPKTSRSR